MNRLFATLVVFSLLLLAIAISFWHTLTRLDIDRTAPLVLLSLLAIAVMTAAAALVSRHMTLQGRRITRPHFEIARPLRRLFSAVWS